MQIKPQSTYAPNLMQDAMLMHLIQNAEVLFNPKKVHKKDDWLSEQREHGQSIDVYARGGPFITWHNPVRNAHIYLCRLDNKVSDEHAEKFKAYLEAFFFGAPIKLIKQGSKLYEKGSKNTRVVKTTIPEDFVSTHAIPTREHNGYFQQNASKINEAMRQYKVPDAFCIMAVQNDEDLYCADDEIFLQDNWYTRGLSDPESSTGIFSLKRFWEDDEESKEGGDPDRGFRQACYTLVHEVCHLFGLKHCIYYECIMNGNNHPEERIRREHKTLCPVCLGKLKMNLKFDCRERYIKLLETCHTLSFTQ